MNNIEETSVEAEIKSYDESRSYINRADGLIPEFTQSYSKSGSVNNPGCPGICIVRGEGSHVFDIDGNEYIDFTHYFVLFVFQGHQNARGPKKGVTHIWQTDNNIYVQANFHFQQDPTVIPGFSYPRQVIKVRKDNLLQFGDISLILLDQNGNQRASKKAIIPE